MVTAMSTEFLTGKEAPHCDHNWPVSCIFQFILNRCGFHSGYWSSSRQMGGCQGDSASHRSKWWWKTAHTIRALRRFVLTHKERRFARIPHIFSCAFGRRNSFHSLFLINSQKCFSVRFFCLTTSSRWLIVSWIDYSFIHPSIPYSSTQAIRYVFNTTCWSEGDDHHISVNAEGSRAVRS